MSGLPPFPPAPPLPMIDLPDATITFILLFCGHCAPVVSAGVDVEDDPTWAFTLTTTARAVVAFQPAATASTRTSTLLLSVETVNDIVGMDPTKFASPIVPYAGTLGAPYPDKLYKLLNRIGPVGKPNSVLSELALMLVDATTIFIKFTR